jgi:hypothetical protein
LRRATNGSDSDVLIPYLETVCESRRGAEAPAAPTVLREVLVPRRSQIRDPTDRAPVERIGEVGGVEPRMGQRARVRIVNRIFTNLELCQKSRKVSNTGFERG